MSFTPPPPPLREMQVEHHLRQIHACLHPGGVYFESYLPSGFYFERMLAENKFEDFAHQLLGLSRAVDDFYEEFCLNRIEDMDVEFDM